MSRLYLRESTPELLPVPGVSLHKNQLHSTIFGVTLQRKLTSGRKSVVNITTYHRPLLNAKSRPKRSRFIDNFWRFCQNHGIIVLILICTVRITAKKNVIVGTNLQSRCGAFPPFPAKYIMASFSGPLLAKVSSCFLSTYSFPKNIFDIRCLLNKHLNNQLPLAFEGWSNKHWFWRLRCRHRCFWVVKFAFVLINLLDISVVTKRLY